MINRDNSKFLTLVFASLLVLVMSCTKDDPVPDPIPEEEEEEEEVVETSQTYIYDIFKDWYFWLDELPELDPANYSSNKSLIDALRYEEVDRWSFVYDLDEYNALFELAETKGFGVNLALTTDNKLMVRFSYEESPMGLVGVDRGWEILKINDVAISAMVNSNAAFDTDNTVHFTFVTTLNDTIEHDVTRADYSINTVLHHSIIHVDGKNVGYLVFQSFLIPSVEELNVVFSDFRANGIDELIVDLRYNGGGSLGVGFYLEGLVGGSEIVGELLGAIMYNKNHSEENIAYHIAGNDYSVDLDRLFFITTDGSASASELVINGMFPFKEVVLIGETTHGKPVGMNVFKSEEFNIAVAPITFQLVNANGEGDYFSGIPVDYEVIDCIIHGAIRKRHA